MRKLLKHRKAMSPVIAAIILIAVTVAVSIAVAAWMGALTIGFMATEQLKITDCKFAGVQEATYTTGGTTDPPGAITVTAPTNTADFTAELWEAGSKIAGPTDSIGDDATKDTVVFTYDFVASTAYTVKITFADEAGDYAITDDGDPAGSGGPISFVAMIIVISAVNTGSAKLVIIDAKVSGLDITGTSLPADGLPVDAGQKATVTIYAPWVLGTAYNVELVTANGNIFPYRATAPS